MSAKQQKPKVRIIHNRNGACYRDGKKMMTKAEALHSTLLPMIADALQQANQSRHRLSDTDDVFRLTKYLSEAESLVCVLECASCGSIGGFDVGQQEASNGNPTIWERFDWLNNKAAKLHGIKASTSYGEMDDKS